MLMRLILQFHIAREANPKQFDSRMRNKGYYGLLGAKDMIKHKYRHLSADMSLTVCSIISCGGLGISVSE